MKKAATVLLWVSIGVEVLYVIAALLGMVIGGATSPIKKFNATVVIAALVMFLITVGIPMLAKVIFAIITLFGLKAKSKLFVTEIIAIVSFSGVFSLLSALLNNIVFMVVSGFGEYSLGSYHYITAGMSWVGFLHSISTVLFIVALSFSIAYKKIELPYLNSISEE